MDLRYENIQCIDLIELLAGICSTGDHHRNMCPHTVFNINLRFNQTGLNCFVFLFHINLCIKEQLWLWEVVGKADVETIYG